MAPLSDVDPAKIPLSLASCSIGLPRHSLHRKLEAISQAGFKGIELSFPDLVSHANELVRLGHIQPPPSSQGSKDEDKAQVAEDDWPALREAAKSAAHLCATHNLQILVLQPFANFEGWPRGSPERDAAFARARGWLSIMAACGCTMLQVGSTDSPGAAGDKAQLAGDLAELADLLAPGGRRVAYENWCWATRAPAWRDAWELVRLAGRDNIGLCLDTFQSAGGEWGDPTTESGQREGEGEAAPLAAWRASLRELAETVPADKIYFLQVSDAYHVRPPLAPRPEPDDASGLRPRGRWSHDYRPLPYDGGYLPIVDFARAVLTTGFRGWLSVEVFDGQFERKYRDDLKAFAEKARASTARLVCEAAGLPGIQNSRGSQGGQVENGVDHDRQGEDQDQDQDQDGRPGDGQREACSMQAARIQRIRGDYEGEKRELPSGQDWPSNHNEVQDKDGDVKGCGGKSP